ncbi:Fic/DOC family protein [Granulicella tundricola]|uniref:protein adenylyltransferase n=1 Tax=Granulicella tundricola (strain ATCC BAA-1859 / DSM 23138 / MP5ACTX9) TaxID=1198114 RepID=E8WXF3_GRATM|nr:Fic family protein [Granulicella tundricola]ADW67486.1 filamentation induced by cAMP protein Fic [Granulicella tundricola MP5ACTX9]
MELSILDPFGDYESAGYLRNVYGLHDLERVGHLETASFREEVLGATRHLRRISVLRYEDVLETHRRLFLALYPWAGQDRFATAPTIAIAKGGYNNLFSHPAECRLAAEYALRLGQDVKYLRAQAGEVFGYLAHSHPFLEGNGRTILTVFAELTRRAGFYVVWEDIDKREFLDRLTDELLQPGKGIMDQLILPYVRAGALTAEMTARRLRVRFQL